MEKDLADLLGGETVAQCAAHVHLDLVLAPERGERREGDDRASATVETVALPVSLWVAITEDSAVPIQIRADNGHALLGREPVDEDWLAPRSSAAWGPIDD